MNRVRVRVSLVLKDTPMCIITVKDHVLLEGQGLLEEDFLKLKNNQMGHPCTKYILYLFSLYKFMRVFIAPQSHKKIGTVDTHLTTTSIKRPPHLKTTFWPEQNISLYFMFDFASLIRPVSL